MTITLSPTELEDYTNKIRQWGGSCLTFILSQPYNEQVHGNLVDYWRTLRRQYEQENPMPTWKDI
jgi:hypothetical protein